MSNLCPLSGRPLGAINVNRHHLVPKSRGGTERFAMHRICHRKIHATFTEKELRATFHTWANLRTHADIAKFVVWVRKKPPEYYDNSVRSRRKRSHEQG
ncbi:MAG: HNH endonuclease [Hyphomicrobiaceae bacterium]